MISRYLSVAMRRGACGLRVAAVAGGAIMLAGCYTTQQPHDMVQADLRQQHPIVLKEGPRTVELFIGEKRGSLTASQRAEVLAFAQEWRRESSGGILIDVPTGSSNAAAAAQATAEVRSLLAAAGVPLQAIDLRENRPRNPGKMATLRLHYPRVMADAGPCGLWPKDLGPTHDQEHYENRHYYNFGCASQRNLAAMVENPADLVQPRGEVPPYTGRRTTVLDKYHRGESTATTYTGTTNGKITEFGN